MVNEPNTLHDDAMLERRCQRIRAGDILEATKDSADWVFVDLGFSEKARSCGLLIGNEQPIEVTFSELRTRLLKIIAVADKPLNLLIEAPLSIAFNEHGNPTRRAIEKREGQTRYWYVGPGCCVLVAATHLLRAVYDAPPNREIRLFEGLASFKPKDVRSSHSDDVLQLRKVIWEGDSSAGVIVPAKELTVSPSHNLFSAFRVAGMDFGIPTVVALKDHIEQISAVTDHPP